MGLFQPQDIVAHDHFVRRIPDPILPGKASGFTTLWKIQMPYQPVFDYVKVKHAVPIGIGAWRQWTGCPG